MSEDSDMADFDYDYDDYLDEEDDDSLYDECGMMPDGQCTMAGSEWCDWDCPLARDRARARIRAMKGKPPTP